MEIAELKRQRIIASAKLDLLTDLYKRGESNLQEVETQKEILLKIRNYLLPASIAMPVIEVNEKNDIVNEIKNKVDEGDEVLKRLRAEHEAIDLKKNACSNKLLNVPINANAKEIVDEIKDLREQWIAKGDEIYYYLRHGKLPEKIATAEVVNNNGAYESELPRDKYELEKLRRNLLPNLSKYKKAMNEAKTDAKKAHYRQMIAFAEIKLNSIENVMSGV